MVEYGKVQREYWSEEMVRLSTNDFPGKWKASRDSEEHLEFVQGQLRNSSLWAAARVGLR